MKFDMSKRFVGWNYSGSDLFRAGVGSGGSAGRHLKIRYLRRG